MIKKNLFILFLISLFQVSFGQSIKYSLQANGNLFGKLLVLSLENQSDADTSFIIYPFYLPSTDNYSGLIVHKAVSVDLKAGQSKDIELAAYTTNIDKNCVFPKGYVFKSFQLENALSGWPLSYEEQINQLQNYNIKMVKERELIPFDYVITNPGSHEFLTFNFNLNENNSLAKSMLREQALNLENGYKRLHLAGKLATHFNNDIASEQALLVQLSMWICASGLEGKPVNKKVVKNALIEIYKNLPIEQKNIKHFRHSWSRYENILERLGAESRVFITSEELDTKPQCLPEIVGYKQTSKAVKVPSLSSHRYLFYNVRNQKYDDDNNCLPCTINRDKSGIIMAWISSRILSENLSQDMILFDKIANNKKADSYYNSLNNLRVFDGHSWIINKEIPEADRMKLAKLNLEQMAKSVDQMPLNDLNSENLANYKAHFSDLLKFWDKMELLYQNQTWNYSLDCCFETKAPGEEHFKLAMELLEAVSWLDQNIPQKIESGNKIDLGFVENYWFMANEVLLENLLDMFRNYASNTQLICIEPKLEYVEDARPLIESFLGIELIVDGYFEGGYYYLPITQTDKLKFKFGSCNCGEQRESTIQFLPLIESRGLRLMNQSSLKPQYIIPRFELGLAVGSQLTASEGLEKFNGGGVGVIKSQVAAFGMDTMISNRFSKGYSFGNSANFAYNNVLNYRFDAGFNLVKNLQLRSNASLAKGYLEGYQQLNYNEAGNALIYDGLLRSVLHIYNAGVGIRYLAGNDHKVFVGVNYNITWYHNEYANLYLKELEIPLNAVPNYRKYTLIGDFGYRYSVNQDLFIDLTYSLHLRYDNDVNAKEISPIDHVFRIGLGTRL